MKEYKILKDGVFCKPYDKKGIKRRLREKVAAEYVKKGDLELLQKPKTPVKKDSEVKEQPKGNSQKKAPKKA